MLKRERLGLGFYYILNVDRFVRRYFRIVGGEYGLSRLFWGDKCLGFCKLNAYCRNLIENFVM